MINGRKYIVKKPIPVYTEYLNYGSTTVVASACGNITIPKGTDLTLRYIDNEYTDKFHDRKFSCRVNGKTYELWISSFFDDYIGKP